MPRIRMPRKVSDERRGKLAQHILVEVIKSGNGGGRGEFPDFFYRLGDQLRGEIAQFTLVEIMRAGNDGNGMMPKCLCGTEVENTARRLGVNPKELVDLSDDLFNIMANS